VDVRNAQDEAKRIAAKIDELTKLRRTLTRKSSKRSTSATPTSAGEPGMPISAPGNFTADSLYTMGPPSARGTALTREVLAELGAVEREDSVRMQLSALKREEAKVSERITQMEHGKALLLKELKRIRDEDASALAHRPTLNERYLLLSMLGKGGFSEVWKALDLTSAKEVAVKVHQLNPAWGDSKKQNYIRHATREYAIHKTLLHPHVVKLHDVFEIDLNSFATVLEYCRGTDLDYVLKAQGTLPEREARAIIMQVLSALRYLNKVEDDSGSSASVSSGSVSQDSSSDAKRGRIIHYDLKPANILFDDSRAVKVTDFGLSKIMDESAGPEASSMELTSQGAGTYYYLPPECFQTGAPPRISSKVDVWSVGVILFQVLFGKRPFGEGQSQQTILDEKVILRAHEVTFPSKPNVTPEARAFIRRCLTHAAALRPDVAGICADPYLRLKLK
jgi:tousled-like kinase